MAMFALRGDDDNALEETVKALIFAVENDDADGVVQHIAGAYATDENGQTPFLLAVMMGKVAALRAFLDEGVEATAILRVKAIVLANLCVAYIVTGDNSKAGLVLTAVTNAETVKLEMEAATEAAAAAGQGRGRHHHAALKHPPSFHSSIINLVIGTLYCAMGQLEFGVGRVLTALEPPSRKLGCDTWYYAKRALLHLGLQLAKGMLVITDSTFDNIFKMLDAAELYGGRLPAEILPPTSTLGSTDAEPPRTIATEARALKTLFLRLREQC